MIVKLIYTLFIGILLALFIGVGIDTFYQQPKMPEYPKELGRPSAFDAQGRPIETPEQIKEQEEYDKRYKQYETDLKIYNRNVSIAALVAAVIVLTASLTFLKKLDILSDGLLLGGVLTLLYSVVRGFNADSPQFRFIVITISLICALTIGYIKFVRPQQVKHH